MDDFIATQIMELEGRTYTIGQLVSVDENNLNEAYKVNPARLLYFSARAAVAEALHSEAEEATKRLYADLDLEYRESLPEQGIKITEPLIKSYVLGDERYKTAQKAENTALRNFKLMRAVVDGLRDRSQMLVSLGAHIRMEYELQDLTLLATKKQMRERVAERKAQGNDGV